MCTAWTAAQIDVLLTAVGSLRSLHLKTVPLKEDVGFSLVSLTCHKSQVMPFSTPEKPSKVRIAVPFD
jgi:hypothetical protein